jgi:hypothetical protein
MRLDHVAPQVHFGGEYDELLLNASGLFAWEVILQKVCFLKRGLDNGLGDD